MPPPEVVVSILAKKGAQARKMVGKLAVRQNQVHINSVEGLLEDTDPADNIVLDIPTIKIHARGGFQPVMVKVKNPQLRRHARCKIDLGDDVSVGPNLVIPRGPYWSQRFGTKVLIPVVNKTKVPQQLSSTEVPARALYPSLLRVEKPAGPVVNTLRFEKSRHKRRKVQAQALQRLRQKVASKVQAQSPGQHVGNPAGGIGQGAALQEASVLPQPATPADDGAAPESGQPPEDLQEPQVDYQDRLNRLYAELGIDKNVFLLGNKKLMGEVKLLLEEYLDIFLQPDGPQVGDTDMMGVDLHLKPGSAPCRAPVRDLNPKLRADLQETINAWLQEGVIEPSSSEWASALVPVKKRDGTVRWAVDFRQINSLLEGDSYPLPNINALLEQSAGKQVYSSLDCTNAYFTLQINQDSRKYTAFISPFGLYQFRKLPFGLKQAPSIYSRFVAYAMQKVAKQDLANYLDDTLLGSHSGEEHLARLREVFQAHREAGLLLKPSKTFLFQTEVRFLGHILSEKGISMDPEYCEKLVEWPKPVLGKELASFLGAASYYGGFLPGFSTRAASLHAVKNHCTISWTPEMEEDFVWIRDSFKDPRVRRPPNWEDTKASPFILTTDWSATGMGYTLTQWQEGQERLLMAAGRKCTRYEANYASWKGELAALVSGFKKFDKFLSYDKFVVRTDSSVLKYLVTMKNPTGITFRWLQFLQQYQFVVEHIRGVNNHLADAISRLVDLQNSDSDPEMEQEERELTNLKICEILQEEDSDGTLTPEEYLDDTLTPEEYLEVSGIQHILQQDEVDVESHLQDIKVAQQEDPLLGIVLEWLSRDSPPSKHEVVGFELHAYKAQLPNLKVDPTTGLLMREYQYLDGSTQRQVVIPSKSILKIWPVFHETAACPHPGLHATLERMRRHFYNPTLHHTVKALHLRCIDCTLRASRTDLKQGAFSRESPSYPNSLWSLDLMGPFDEYEGQRYIFSIQDCFSRYTCLLPLPDKKSTTVATKLWEVISMLGLPAAVKHDFGGEFESAYMQQMKEIWSIGTRRSVPYFHASNPVERAHREVNRMLQLLLPGEATNWPDYLPAIRIAYNSKVNANTGASPNLLYFGRESLHPIQLHLPQLPLAVTPAEHLLHLRARVEMVMAKMHQAQTAYFNKMSDVYRPFKDKFEVGDEVYYVSTYGDKQKKAAKLCYSWAGPATVLEVNGSYLKLQTTQWNGHQKVLHLHGAVCRKAQPRDVPQPGSPVYLEPEAVDEYILPPIPLHQPMDIYPEEDDTDDHLATPDVGYGLPPLPDSEEPASAAEAPPDLPAMPETPHTPHSPPPPVPPPADPPISAEPALRRSNREVKLPAKLQDYSLELLEAPRFEPACYQHFFRNSGVT